MTEKPVAVVTLIMLPLVTFVASILLSVRIAEQRGLEGDRRLCASVLATVEAYRETPPATEAGRNLQRAQEDLLISLECPPKE